MVAAVEAPPHPSATACRADPAASLKICIRLKPACVAAAEDAGRVAERRACTQEERFPMEPLSTSTTKRREDEEGSGASKKKQASERVERVPCTRTRPEEASCVKEETMVRAHAAVRDGGTRPRAIKNGKTGERRQEKDAKNAQERARMRRPRVPSTRTTRPAAPAPSCTKKETLVHAHAAVHDDDVKPRAIKNCKTDEQRQEKDAKNAQESARMRSPRVPSTRTTRPAAPAPSCGDDDVTPRAIKKCKTSERTQKWDGENARQCMRTSSPRVQQSPGLSPSPAARPDPLSAQNSLRAAIDRARPALYMRRDAWLQREAARRELEKMVRTVEFNDPFISPQDVLKP